MITNIKSIWLDIRASFWFLPSLMIIAAIILAFDLQLLEKLVSVDTDFLYGFFFLLGADGARSFLSTIAAATITIASITFSITIVVLNLASTQFGPRLIRNFREDRDIQAVLGFFTATFIYCLLVLRSIGSEGPGEALPTIAVLFATVLAIANVWVLIFFIHHIAKSIQVEEVISAVSNELFEKVDAFFSEEAKLHEHIRFPDKETESIEDLEKFYTYPLKAAKRGYMHCVEYQRLFSLSEKNDITLKIFCRAGDHVLQNQTLAMIYSKDIFAPEKSDKFLQSFIISRQRTPLQDVEYSINQLVEIAVRALSPGVNDPFTAVACIDRLGSAISHIFTKDMPPSSLYNENNKLRIERKVVDSLGIVDACFNQIRQNGYSVVAVATRLMETLTKIAEQSRIPEHRQALYKHANDIYVTSSSKFSSKRDREDLFERYKDLVAYLNSYYHTGENYAVIDAKATL